ncbi:hypothetical protein KJI95_03845 [Shewanella sp. JM162201]|uniref:Uncharacterized protein n=1 Tax=Shewanella jiangmenensis TaxID=2837387 RepID=A0ABS5V212_9GAMM|nr:hypothetical protein [Shewanella jiangmenensis]MBT1443656.1 hypothetical protein [Shewanella jiangmenensis]
MLTFKFRHNIFPTLVDFPNDNLKLVIGVFSTESINLWLKDGVGLRGITGSDGFIEKNFLIFINNQYPNLFKFRISTAV